MFNNMFVNGIYFTGGLITATIIWFFVLKNNKRHFNEWLYGIEQYLMEAINKIDGISEEASAKIDAVFNQLKEIRK